MNLPRRATSYTVDEKSAKNDIAHLAYLEKKAPQWVGAGRYRFSGPFTRMAVKGEVNRNYTCGTRYPGYLKDPKAHDMKIGDTKEKVWVCFYSHWHATHLPNSCPYYSLVTITRCPGDYFVYRLPNLGQGFCGA